jgi:hypothetical protein
MARCSRAFLIVSFSIISTQHTVSITHPQLSHGLRYLKTDSVANESSGVLSSVALEHGKYVAKLYQSRKCEQLRRDKNAIKQIQSIVAIAENPQRLENEVMVISDVKHLSSSLKTPKTKNAIYVRNQKVASMLLMEEAYNYAGAPGSWKGLYTPYVWNTNTKRTFTNDKIKLAATNHKIHLQYDFYQNRPESDMYFTVVRDPISCFVAGFLEVMCRSGSIPMRKKKGADAGKSLLMSKNDGELLFQQFLDDLEGHRYLGPESFHVWPQVVHAPPPPPTPSSSLFVCFSTQNYLFDYFPFAFFFHISYRNIT